LETTAVITVRPPIQTKRSLTWKLDKDYSLPKYFSENKLYDYLKMLSIVKIKNVQLIIKQKQIVQQIRKKNLQQKVTNVIKQFNF